MPSRSRVVVVGSLNVDYIARVTRLPAAGETVAASSLVRRFGGKGANQAVAAARQGARVVLIGCVGADDEGRAYLKRLRNERIDARGVSVAIGQHTGLALIAVDDSAENSIVVSSGANAELKPKAVEGQRDLISSSGILLLQFEVPLPSVFAAIQIANRSNVPVVLNPSPLRKDFPWGQYRLDTLITNESEAEAIFNIEDLEHERRWPARLKRGGIETLIVTRGERPTLCITCSEITRVPALFVKPVDTVGAGDAFAGAYVAARAESLELPGAVRRANCAGGLATLKRGAQESIPGRLATDKALRHLP